MFAAELTFKRKPKSNTEQCIEALWTLLSALRRNGQIFDDFFFAQNGRGFRGYIQLPETTALNHQHDDKSVIDAYVKLGEVGVTKPLVKVVGKTDGEITCTCVEVNSYILFTNRFQVSSPVSCGHCFGSVPLYRLPKTYDGNTYGDVLAWESDYQSCDSLQLGCQTGERFGTREMSDLNSSLSKRGRELCKTLEQLTGKPAYYYLFRNNAARSLAPEQKRRCPSCNGEWLLAEPFMFFDFRCEPCRLLSNISWNIRHS